MKRGLGGTPKKRRPPENGGRLAAAVAGARRAGSTRGVPSGRLRPCAQLFALPLERLVGLPSQAPSKTPATSARRDHHACRELAKFSHCGGFLSLSAVGVDRKSTRLNSS